MLSFLNQLWHACVVRRCDLGPRDLVAGPHPWLWVDGSINGERPNGEPSQWFSPRDDEIIIIISPKK